MMNLLAESEQQHDNKNKSYEKEANEVVLDCLNNIAAVYLKAKEYKKAKDAATEVLLRDKDNFKALLRAARAAIYDQTATFEESQAALAAAENVHPEDKDVRKIKSELENRRKKYKKERKELLSRMSLGISASSSGQSTRETVPTSTQNENNSDENNVSEAFNEPLPKQAVWWRKYVRFILQFLLPLAICYCFFMRDRILQTLERKT